MGNCLKHPSTVEYTDDDEFWDYTPEKEIDYFQAKDVGGGAGKTTEVKIKITKKQLEALLGKLDVKDLRADEFMVQLISHSHRSQTHQRPWKPALQSIPEL
ncbi:uncharacterized protein LOC129304049 [Prosopis cineraria]|uniref:uncharacterized protein LOC129304049 n=1 Tax=Prosopis cineraria TaxID=364024 RepID=UPI00241061D8|nr:uncharacterized protein LOC129304049 [Prosopis cineraria]